MPSKQLTRVRFPANAFPLAPAEIEAELLLRPPAAPKNFWTSRSAAAKSRASPSGNRTPVFRVTGGDTVHYTNEESRTQAFSPSRRAITDITRRTAPTA
ncbi:proline-rich 2 [Labeo rohita]|uniref:Proline-rich 2 n=1 Tax=Labeo rohita TaxID=84645 RepID=A0A498NLJ0_LABRO|nr:proline-rich 2 [Labeo rohita]